MSDAEYNQYQRLIYDTCGINFTDNKKQLLMTRLRKRMVALNIISYKKYREYVTHPDHHDEFSQMLNVISTNKTDFFRESVHFEFLKNNVYPRLERKNKIRLWSAASSSGEEAYTWAITILEHLRDAKDKDIKILATDISTKVLAEAEAGVYSEELVRPIPVAQLKKYFYKGHNQWNGYYMVKEQLKELVSFRRLNLMEPFPLKAQFDVILCRNVMIYFDKETRERLVERLARQLTAGGIFIIGNAESLSGIKTSLKYLQPAIYQK